MKNQNQWAVYLFFAIIIVLSLLDQGALLPYLVILQLPFLLILFIKKEKFSLPLLKPIILITVVFIINFLISANKQFTFERILIWLTTFLIFWIFYNLNFKAKDKKLFINLLIYTSLLLVPFFLYYRINHTVTHASALSMIQPMTGHVHISSLFLLSLTASFLTKKYFYSLILFVALTATNSVSAFLALFIGSLSLNFIPNQLTNSKNKKITFIVASITLIALLLFSFKTPPILNNLDPIWAKKKIGGARFQYWGQAVKGFITRPITGWGLDTSGIISTKFKSENYYYSLYPHGFLFKIIAETGLIGIIAFIYLIIQLIKSISLKSKTNKIIVSIIIISALESLTDFGWQFPSIMFILAAGLGIVIKKVKTTKTRTTALLMISLLLAIISTGLVASTHFKRQGKYDLAQFLYPLDQEIYVENYENINPQLSNFLFGQDPYFWGKLSFKFNNKNKANWAITAKEKQIKELYPNQPPKEKLDLTTLYLNNDQASFAANILFQKVWSPHIKKDEVSNFSTQEKRILFDIKNNYPSLLEKIIRKNNKIFPIDNNSESFYTKLLYDLGLELYIDSSNNTKTLWEKAVQIKPEWSYFHIDLANLYWHTGNKEKAIRQLSENCQEFHYPKEHCLLYLEAHSQKEFDHPGSMKKLIEKNFE